jgi:hypothetical protein
MVENSLESSDEAGNHWLILVRNHVLGHLKSIVDTRLESSDDELGIVS